MGCFDVTCAVTQTAIHYRDNIFGLRINKKFDKYLEKYWNEPAYSIYGKIRMAVYEATEGSLDSSFEYSDICNKQGIERTTESYVKWLEDNKEANQKKAMDSLAEYTAHGEYNDYGWIEGATEIVDWSNEMYHIIYVHEFAMEILLEKPLSEIKAMSSGQLVYELCTKAEFLRLNIFGHGLLGQQHRDDEEMEKQLRLAEGTCKFLKEKIEEYNND